MASKLLKLLNLAAGRQPRGFSIAILANNAWYNFSSAGSKLKKFAQVYAAQYQRPILLSANFGESAIISHTGKLMETANHHQSAILSSEIKINTSKCYGHILLEKNATIFVQTPLKR